jgi:SAM-dependent methyltransferase
VKPTDLTTTETLRYCEEHLPARSRILDVGCGAGELTRRLQDAGHRVIGIDSEPEEIEKALALGVDARHADFLQFEDDPFDVILFSFSLHHVFPLEGALEHVDRLLGPDGLLLAEEFAWDEMDQSSARWFYGMWSLLDSCGVLSGEYGEGGEHHHHSYGADRDTGTKPATPLDEWREEHHHDPPLHTGKQMLEGVGGRFDSVSSHRVPTLYSDFAAALEPSERGYDIARKLLDLERSLIDDGTLVPLGLRFVGKKKG